MDTATVLGFTFGYFATIAGVFVLYLPVVVLLVSLLITAGVLRLLLQPFVILIRKLRRSRPEPEMDGSWILNQSEQ
jgi:hypothetical protein